MAAVYPVASQFPVYSGTMIPEVWSSKILVKFYQKTVLTEIANTDYEGEIKNQGDTVHIRTTPSITISDHKMGDDLEYETPEPGLVDLLIDKGKRWAFISDDVAKGQADYNYVDDWTGDAGKQMKISIERSVFASVYADAHAKNKGTAAGVESGSINLGTTGSPVALDKTNIIDYIVDCGTVLDEQNVPEEDRWMLLPPWACGLIKKSELKDSSLTGDSKSILRESKERLGMIDRFTLINSNLLSKVTDGAYTVTNAMFGHKSALTFATQLTKSEGPMRDVKVFGDHYRGLNVYGFKTVKTEAMGHWYIRKG